MLPYTESGAGETILVFLHFFGSSRREWHHVIAQLAPAHHCIAADMPGFGGAAEITGYSVAEMAAHVDALVRSFAPHPVVLVGHSMSGKVCMVVAATPPANLRQLVLVAPSPLQPEPMTEEARATMTFANTTPERAGEFVRGGAHRRLNDNQFAIAMEDVFRANPAAWRAWPQSGSREDWSTRVTELNVPATLIVGEYDKAIPLDFQKTHTLPLVERTGGKWIVIQDAAHLLPYEVSGVLVAELRQVVRF